MLRKDYLQNLNLKSKFIGVKKGFDLLNLFLDKIKKNQINEQLNKKTKNVLNIYDYRDNSIFTIICDYNVLYSDLQYLYIEFLIKEKFQKYEWFNRFRECIYITFERKIEIFDDFAEIIIKIFVETFILFSNLDNVIELHKFEQFIVSKLVFLTDDLFESSNYTKFIVESLIANHLLIKDKNNIVINDKFIHYDFCITSLNLSPFFTQNIFDLKYNCRYGSDSLILVIDYYLSHLVYTDSYEKSLELFSYNPLYSECFPFLMNYDDDEISKIPKLIKPYEDLFKAFFFKKLLLNEYCFQIIIMSCFEYYIFNNKIKNILQEKADPKLNFRDDIIYSFLK